MLASKGGDSRAGGASKSQAATSFFSTLGQNVPISATRSSPSLRVQRLPKEQVAVCGFGFRVGLGRAWNPNDAGTLHTKLDTTIF